MWTDDRTLRVCIAENQYVRPGTSDRHMQYLAALGVRCGIIFPNKRGTVAFPVKDDTVELLTFAFVHIHNVDAPQLIGPRKKLFLRKGVIQSSTRSGVAAISEPKLGKVCGYPLPSVEGNEVVKGFRNRNQRQVTRSAQRALYLCPVTVRAASMPNFRCCLEQLINGYDQIDTWQASRTRLVRPRGKSLGGLQRGLSTLSLVCRGQQIKKRRHILVALPRILRFQQKRTDATGEHHKSLIEENLVRDGLRHGRSYGSPEFFHYDMNSQDRRD